MGREVKRVSLSFDWPIRTVWSGYQRPSKPCPECLPHADVGGPDEDCHECYGDGDVCDRVEPPEGVGWQMWETTSEGSPISPVCESPEALARWLADNKASTFGRDTTTYDRWLAMIVGGGWAPSMVMTAGRGIESGVDFVARKVPDAR